MTQTRKEALTDLLEKVEAGSFDQRPGGEQRPRFNAFMDIAEQAFDSYGPVGLPQLAWRAYNGESVDAFMAIRKAMLPLEPFSLCPWRVCLGNGHCAENAIPARAGLMAILKALIAQEPDQ